MLGSPTFTTVPVVSRDSFVTDPFFLAARETLEKSLLELSQKHRELQALQAGCIAAPWCCSSQHALERLGNWTPAILIPCIICCPNQVSQSPTPQPWPPSQERQVINDPALYLAPAQLSFTSSNFELLLDMHGFLPQEIKVTVKDDFIEVSANQSQLQPQVHAQSVLKRYKLPAPVNNDLVQCSLSKDGILFLTAPWKWV